MVVDPTPEWLRRFWSRVRKERKCWVWTAGTRNEYGIVCYRGRDYYAHRLSYALVHSGEVPDDLCVLHKCDNPSCVNPKHLWLGTTIDNNADRHAKGRTSHVSRNVGDDNGLRRHPERSPAVLYPELFAGEKNGRSKLKEEDVRAIRAAWIPGDRTGAGSQAALARKYGVTQANISSLLRGATWRNVE